MPLCPQVTITPVTVTATGMTQSSVIAAGAPATTEQLSTVSTDATAALAAATAAQASAASAIATANTAQSTATSALANAATAYNAAVASLQPSANTIVNASNQMTAIAANGITVFSGASSSSGPRVVLNSTGLAGFSSVGATFSISATTGAAVFSGSVTGATITASTMNIGGNAIIDASGYLTATGATITGNITATSGTFTGTVYASAGSFTGAVTATSGSFTGSIFSTSGTIGGFTLSSTSIFSSTNLVIESTGNISGGNSQTLFYGFVNIGGGSVTGERLIVAGTSALNGNTGVLGNLSVTNSATFGAVTQQFEFLSSTGNVRVASTYGNSVSGRSMQISSSGLYGTTASTRRKKHDIKSYSINSAALLELDVKEFKYKPEFDAEQKTQHGFIAEEAQELGLDELIQYDSTGLPDYFAYEKLPVFLLQLIKELKAEIDTLKWA